MLERIADWLRERPPADSWEAKVAEVYAWRRRGAPPSETPQQLFDPFFEMPGESWDEL